MRDYIDRRVAFGCGLVPLGRQAEKRKELSFALPATQKRTKLAKSSFFSNEM